MMDKEWILLVQEIEQIFGIQEAEDWLADKKRLLKRFRDLLTIKLKKAVISDPQKASLLNDKTNYRDKNEQEIETLLNTFKVHNQYEFDLRTLQTALDLSDQTRNIQKRTQNAFAIFSGYASYLDYVSKKHLGTSKSSKASNHKQFEDEVFLNFQNRFVQIQQDWSIRVNQAGWQPNETEIRAIERYWYLVFDEWFFCTQRNENLKNLWENHYKQGVMRAFDNTHFKNRLEYLLKLGEFSPSFARHINELCFIATGKELAMS